MASAPSKTDPTIATLTALIDKISELEKAEDARASSIPIGFRRERIEGRACGMREALVHLIGERDFLVRHAHSPT